MPEPGATQYWLDRTVLSDSPCRIQASPELKALCKTTQRSFQGLESWSQRHIVWNDLAYRGVCLSRCYRLLVQFQLSSKLNQPKFDMVSVVISTASCSAYLSISECGSIHVLSSPRLTSSSRCSLGTFGAASASTGRH